MIKSTIVTSALLAVLCASAASANSGQPIKEHIDELNARYGQTSPEYGMSGSMGGYETRPRGQSAQDFQAPNEQWRAWKNPAGPYGG
jgi:hypothetical protein